MQKFKVIIPAAGKATRMRPLSNSMSKAMIPVNGKPIISFILDELYKIGNPYEIVIVHNELGDIQRFLNHAYPKQVADGSIMFAQQHSPKGPLHAIQVGNELLSNSEENNDPVMVWLGDTICLEESFKLSTDFLVTAKVDDFQRWCLVDNNCVFYDKPELNPGTDKALIGIYYFANYKVFQKSLEEGMLMPKIKDEHQISSLLDSYLKNGRKFKLKVTGEWYDCGDLQSFYSSKAKLLNRSARAFNHISVDTFLGIVKKSADSADKQKKIQEEKEWFLKLPETASLFCPRVLQSKNGELHMSHEPGTPLNEIWLYEDLRYDIWEGIYGKLLKIHNEVFLDSTGISHTPEEIKVSLVEMYLLKNWDRLKEMKKKFDFLDFSIVEDFVKSTGNQLTTYESSMWSKVLHGDSHLGNILFEPLHGTFKFVDPRGKFGNLSGTEGDMRYDMAKLTQDAFLYYADILAGNYKIENNKVILFRDTRIHSRVCEFLKKELTSYGYDWVEIFKLATVLIITCIPFHADDPQRQLAFWLIAIERIKWFNTEGLS